MNQASWLAITRYGSLSLYVFSGLCISWIAFRAWKRLTPPPMRSESMRPTAIKGPSAFGPHDAELFRRLGREADIAVLLGHILNDQINLVVVYGDSGAGKTSLLRAGVPAALKGQIPAIEYHYWEAIPSDVERRILAAIQDEWQTPPDAPQKLIDIFGPATGALRRVIVLDQFEQLSPKTRSFRPLFQWLKHAVTVASPPYKVTLVIAFRRDYLPTWSDFEYDELAPYRSVTTPIRLFSAKQARDVMAILAQAAGIEIDEELAEDLVESMKNNQSLVSPADVGITLLALSERALSKPNGYLSKGDYGIAGGATGLMVDYISSRLERYQSSERGKILTALLELADLGNDQRFPEGRTPAQLAEKVSIPLETLERILSDLASPQVRLLETLPTNADRPTPAYRLTHERLIPALRQLSGVMLAEWEQTNRQFNRAYTDWVAGKQRRELLISGRVLRDTLRYRPRLNFVSDRDGKEYFLRQSLQRRRWRRVACNVGAIALSVAAYLLWDQIQVWEYKRDLAFWKMPGALYNDLGQLKSLSIYNDRLTHLLWIHDCGLTKLTLTARSLDDTHDLTRCPALTDLKLSFGLSRVDLGPLKKLKALTTLSLTSYNISSLAPLKELGALTNLSVLGSAENLSLAPLTELAALTKLTLNIYSGRSGLNLDPLKTLRAQISMTLNYDGHFDLEVLKEFPTLTELTITPSYEYQGGYPLRLDLLKELKALTNLSLDLSRIDVTGLDQLKELKALTELSLDLNRVGVNVLDQLKELKALTNLSLNLSGVDVAGLDQLKELKALTNLSLNLRGSNVSSLDRLKELKTLTKLTLYVSSLDSLKELKELKALTDLSLNLSGDVSSLDQLKQLKELKTLTNLSLGLGDTNVTSVYPLKELKALTSLSLEFTGGNVSSLDPLKELKALTDLELGQFHTQNPLDDLLFLQDLNKLNKVHISTDRTYELGRLPESVTELSLNVY